MHLLPLGIVATHSVDGQLRCVESTELSRTECPYIMVSVFQPDNVEVKGTHAPDTELSWFLSLQRLSLDIHYYIF